jgi:hypothetical protein
MRLGRMSCIRNLISPLAGILVSIETQQRGSAGSEFKVTGLSEQRTLSATRWIDELVQQAFRREPAR